MLRQQRLQSQSQNSSLESNPPSQIDPPNGDDDSYEDGNHMDEEEEDEHMSNNPSRDSNPNPTRESRVTNAPQQQQQQHNEREEEEEEEDGNAEEGEEDEEADAEEAELATNEPILSEKGRSLLRKKYNELYDTTKTETVSEKPQENIKTLMKKLEKGNMYLKKVQLPRESNSDAKFFSRITLLGAEVVNSIEVENVISPQNVIDYLKTNHPVNKDIGGETRFKSINWKELGRSFLPQMKLTPSPAFMNGPMQLLVEQKPVRKEKRKRSAMDDAEEVKPEEMATVESQEKEGDKLFRRIKSNERPGHKKIPFFKGIFEENPNFSNSVDSIFNFSYLVKAGKAKLEVDAKNKRSLIEVTDSVQQTQPNASSSQNPKSNDTKQCIMTWNRSMYEKAMYLWNLEKTNAAANPRPQQPPQSR